MNYRSMNTEHSLSRLPCERCLVESPNIPSNSIAKLPGAKLKMSLETHLPNLVVFTEVLAYYFSSACCTGVVALMNPTHPSCGPLSGAHGPSCLTSLAQSYMFWSLLPLSSLLLKDPWPLRDVYIHHSDRKVTS
jgi:hypothetical protein